MPSISNEYITWILYTFCMYNYLCTYLFFHVDYFKKYIYTMNQQIFMAIFIARFSSVVVRHLNAAPHFCIVVDFFFYILSTHTLWLWWKKFNLICNRNESSIFNYLRDRHELTVWTRRCISIKSDKEKKTCLMLYWMNQCILLKVLTKFWLCSPLIISSWKLILVW